jgi:hypothetical protein
MDIVSARESLFLQASVESMVSLSTCHKATHPHLWTSMPVLDFLLQEATVALPLAVLPAVLEAQETTLLTRLKRNP